MILSMHIGIGTSTSRDHIQAAKEAVESARLGLGKKKIDVAFVFSTIDFAHAVVLKTIAELLGDTPILGCSSLGILCDKGILKYGLAVILLSMPEDSYFNAACVRDISNKGAGACGEELGEKLLYGCKGVRRTVSIVFSDGILLNGYELISGLQKKLGRSFPLVGASASDNLAFKKTYIYFGDQILSDAACGVLFGGKWSFGLGCHHGWKALGKMRRVTKSSGNRVSEIDSQPASKIYEDYFAKNIDSFRHDLKRIAMLYPIGIKIPGEKEYLLRNVIGIDNGSLVFQGDVPQDSTIRLMIGTKDSCLQAAAQAAEDVKNNLAGHAIKFALIFNSATRSVIFGRHATAELKTIKEKLGKNIPLIGLYTYAEQAPLGSINYLGKTYFHSHTITLLAVAL